MEAFEKLIYRYDKHVMAIAASYRNSREDARDIYQEVFLRVYKGLKNFEGKSEFSTWLYRITANVCITFKSQAKKFEYTSIDRGFSSDDDYGEMKLSDMLTDGAAADQQLMDEEISKNVRDAMDSLSPQQKMVFTLKHLQELKIKEIAEIMKCGEGTIKKYLFTATQKMREKLKDFID